MDINGLDSLAALAVAGNNYMSLLLTQKMDKDTVQVLIKSQNNKKRIAKAILSVIGGH